MGCIEAELELQRAELWDFWTSGKNGSAEWLEPIASGEEGLGEG